MAKAKTNAEAPWRSVADAATQAVIRLKLNRRLFRRSDCKGAGDSSVVGIRFDTSPDLPVWVARFPPPLNQLDVKKTP
jgi:hypothetical protein